MKHLVMAILVVTAAAEAVHSQNINWRSLDENQRNTVQLNLGHDYGVTSQLGYSRSFTIVRPLVVGVDFSVPMGSTLLDDFKVRIGGQVELVETGGFSVTVKIASNFRRYQTQLVRIVSFGSDLGVLAGYYTSSWYAAGEFGFDKAVATHLRHSDIMKASFPGIRDAWYVPTGGNYYFGIQGGASLGRSFDVSLRLGRTRAQMHDEGAVVPYYAQVGFGLKF